MNILGDFISRVDALYPADIDNEELNALLTAIRNQASEIETKEKEKVLLKAKAEKLANENDKLRAKLEQYEKSDKPKKTKAATTKKAAKK